MNGLSAMYHVEMVLQVEHEFAMLQVLLDGAQVINLRIASVTATSLAKV